jgi:hypothetical protein
VCCDELTRYGEHLVYLNDVVQNIAPDPLFSAYLCVILGLIVATLFRHFDPRGCSTTYGEGDR